MFEAPEFSTINRLDGNVIAAIDEAGAPAKIDGDISLTVEDSTFCELTNVEANGGRITFDVIAKAPGVTRILMSADAKIGDGVAEINDQIIVTITEAEAARFNVVFGMVHSKSN